MHLRGRHPVAASCHRREGFADEHKRSPEVGVGIRFAKSSDRALERSASGFGTREARVERCHELRGALIIDIPECKKDRLRPRIKKPTNEAEQFITGGDYVQSRGAAAQSDEFSVKFQMVQVVQVQIRSAEANA